MRKKTIIVIAALMSVLTVGCSQPEVTKEEPKKDAVESVEKKEETKAETEKSEDKVEWSKLIPHPTKVFSEPTITTAMTSDHGVFYEVENYKDGEYEAYVQACKDNGFTNISNEFMMDGTKTFSAYDESGEYYVSIYLTDEDDYISITGTVVTTNDNAEETAK